MKCHYYCQSNAGKLVLFIINYHIAFNKFNCCSVPYSYVTASKVILLSRSLQKISARYVRSGGFRKPIMDMLEKMTKDMATRFHKVEFHHLLSEASALDPRFKKSLFR